MARFEIKLLDIRMEHGQGAAEGAFEMQVRASMHPGDTVIVWPDTSGDPMAYRKVPTNGANIAIDRVVGSVVLAHDEKREVTVDLRVTEVDKGLQGANDYANASVEFELSEGSGNVTTGTVLTLVNAHGPTKGKVRVRVAARRI